MVGESPIIVIQGQALTTEWGSTLRITGLTASMAVNALVTSLIVFKILKVFLEVKANSGERTLSSTAGGKKYQHIIFIIIESALALFAIQLVRVVLSSLIAGPEAESTSIPIALNFVIATHQMLNVVIRSIHFYIFCFTDNIYLFRASHQQLFWCGSQ